jgi:hypothetical protein
VNIHYFYVELQYGVTGVLLNFLPHFLQPSREQIVVIVQDIHVFSPGQVNARVHIVSRTDRRFIFMITPGAGDGAQGVFHYFPALVISGVIRNNDFQILTTGING